MTPELKKKIGIAVSERRRLMLVSQVELAERCRINRSNLCGIEKGLRPVSLAMLERIAQSLDCEISITLKARPKENTG